MHRAVTLDFGVMDFEMPTDIAGFSQSRIYIRLRTIYLPAPSSRLAVWIYRVIKNTVGTISAMTVASRPKKLTSMNLPLSFLKIICLI